MSGLSKWTKTEDLRDSHDPLIVSIRQFGVFYCVYLLGYLLVMEYKVIELPRNPESWFQLKQQRSYFTLKTFFPR